MHPSVPGIARVAGGQRRTHLAPRSGATGGCGRRGRRAGYPGGGQDLPQDCEIVEAPITAPERFDAGLVVAPPSERAPELGHPAHGGAHIHRRGRRLPAAGVGRRQCRPLGRTPDGGTQGLRRFVSQVGPPPKTPGDDPRDGQRPVPAVDAFERAVFTVTAILEDVMIRLDPPAIGVVTPDRFRRGQIVRSIRAMGGVPSGGNSSRTPTTTVEAGNCSARRCRPTRAVRVGASSCRGATPAGVSRAGGSAPVAHNHPVASTNRRRSRAARTKPSRPVAVTWQRHRTRPVPGRPPG